MSEGRMPRANDIHQKSSVDAYGTSDVRASVMPFSSVLLMIR